MPDPQGAAAQGTATADVNAEQQLVQNLYNNIITTLTSKPPGASAPAFDPQTTILVMRTPGLPINKDEFRDPYDPSNTDIDPSDVGRAQAAAKNTAELANVGVALSGAFTPNKGTISDTYSLITNATVVPTHLTDDQRKAMVEASRVVYKKVPDMTPGKPLHFDRSAKNYTDDYKAYLDARKAYRKAVAKFNQKFIDFQSDPTLKAKWPLVGPGFLAEVNDAWSTLQDAGANDFRAAEATLATAASNQVAEFFADSKFAFANASLLFGTGTHVYPVTMTPSDWWDATNEDNWVHVDASAGRTDSTFHKDSHSFSASASVNFGLWSFGANASHTDSHEHSASASGGVTIKYWYQIVDIERDWLSNMLFQLPNWSIGGFKKNDISTGLNDDKGQFNSKLPIIPTALLLVKDVVITAGFTQEEQDKVTSHTAGGGSVGYGPFSVGAQYSTDSEDGSFGFEFAKGGLTIHGAQVIAYVGTVVHACPPMDGATK